MEIGDIDRFSSPRKLWSYTRDDRLGSETTGRYRRTRFKLELLLELSRLFVVTADALALVGSSLLGLRGAGVQLLGPGGLLVGEGGLLGRVLAQS
jgi:hypothetical protein